MEDQDFGLLPGSTDPNMITLQPLQPNDVSYIIIFLKLLSTYVFLSFEI